MAGTDDPARPPVGRARERAIATLSERFADGDLDLDDFEDRVDSAHRAGTVEALDALVADLELDEALVASGDGPAPPAAPSSTSARAPRKTMVSVLSENRRDGSWRAPENLRVVNVLGATTVDFRDVALPAGVTEVRLAAVLGRVEIIVPPELAVECEGASVLGEVEELHRCPPAPDPDRPLLRITGVCLLGRLEITTRLPGESRRAARRRQRAARGDHRIAERKRRQLDDKH